jgi:hypothetical protein
MHDGDALNVAMWVLVAALAALVPLTVVNIVVLWRQGPA